MFWESIAAIMLLLFSLPIWLFVAMIWGLIKAFFSFIGYLASFLESRPIEWGDIWIVPLAALAEGVASAWSVPTAIWDWAKFEHPWWAFFIAVALMMFGGGSRAR